MSGFSDPSSNLLDWLELVCNSNAEPEKICARVSYRDQGSDAFLVGRRGAISVADLPSGTLDSAVRIVTGRGRSEGRIYVDIPDDRVEALGRLLEAEQPDSLALRGIAKGERWLVNFADPNTTKALHIGHLRNLAIGQAIASMAEVSGADVVRQSRVGDFGRNMGEAMAGYLEFADETARQDREFPSPEPLTEQSDHFVGRHYARYVSRNREPTAVDAGVSAGDAALARERHLHNDRAEELLQGWLSGRERERNLFSRIRTWAVQGQNLTMARLGIVMDRTLFESDFLQAGDALLETGLSTGLFVRADSGAILFPTGSKEFPHLLLTRSDGFPTQHLRYIATWWAISEQCSDVHTIGVLGSEWGPLSRCTAEILEKLDEDARAHPKITALHGMVTSDRRVVKSSGGGALLLDTILEELLASPDLAALGAHVRCSSHQLARIIVLSLFLRYSTESDISLAPETINDPDSNWGWVLAKAWAQVWHPKNDGEPDPDIDEIDYRRLVVRSQVLRRSLNRGLRQVDPVPLMLFLRHLSEWFLTSDCSPRTARVMRSLLAAGFEAMGLLTVAPDYAVQGDELCDVTTA